MHLVILKVKPERSHNPCIKCISYLAIETRFYRNVFFSKVSLANLQKVSLANLTSLSMTSDTIMHNMKVKKTASIYTKTTCQMLEETYQRIFSLIYIYFFFLLKYCYKHIEYM